jgi:hypothetical protein
MGVVIEIFIKYPGGPTRMTVADIYIYIYIYILYIYTVYYILYIYIYIINCIL